MNTRNSVICFLFALVFSFQLQAQFTMDSLNRDTMRYYYVHVPTNYNPANPASIVVWLHGMGQITVNDVQNLYAAHQFIPIADTANFILLVPVAIDYYNFGTHMRAWNSKAGLNVLGTYIYPNASIDDFGFINEMLDTVIANYSVNQQELFLCGFSMGGFMTERFALQDNSRFAAYASVAGTIGSGISNYAPGKAIRIAHFHGTDDGTVAYNNNTFGIDPDSLVTFWVDNNNCDTVPISHTVYNDAGTNGQLTIDHFVYSNGNQDVEFFKENGATHEWLPKTSTKIWLFFNNYNYMGESPAGIQSNVISPNISIFPNPAQNKIHIELSENNYNSTYEVAIYSLQGERVFHSSISSSDYTISLKEENITNGMYILRLEGNSFHYTQKIIIQ